MLQDTLDVNEFVSIQCDGSLLPAKFEEKFYGSLYFISEGGRDYCRGSCGPTIGEWFSFFFLYVDEVAIIVYENFVRIYNY